MNEEVTGSAGLTEEHLELLASLLEREGFGGEERPAIRRRGDTGETGEVPLSFAQQRLWFLDQWQPGTAQYNLHADFRVGLPLDPALLERAVAEVVRRHDALRTTFAAVQGRAVQVVALSLAIPVAVHDLAALPAPELEAEVQRLATAEARKPFDLARGPLLRLALLRCGQAGDVLLSTMHHIVSDGWSMQVLAREIAVLYRAFAQGLPSPLPELPIQYADFACWQREWLQGEVLEEQLAYWRGQLAGAPTVLDLPADRSRPALQSFRGGSEQALMAPALQEALREVGRERGATMFMVLLAAFGVLLQRYAGRDDLLVGSPIANRNRPEIEGLIGFFVNTLVLRVDLAGDPSFRDLVARVRATTLAAYDHQDLPFEKLVEELRPERDAAHAPLCQVVLGLETAAGGPAPGEGLPWTPLPVRNGTAKFDLTLSLFDAPRGLGCVAEYASDLFEPATLRRLLGHFETLLAGAAADPGRRLSELPLLTPGERAELATAPTAGPWSGVGVCLHHRFAAEAARRPLAPAVTCGTETLTYGDLERSANRLAHRLRALGVGPESRVALCLDRSLDLVIAVLGTLKAGGAYVPLDPAYPRERLGFILADTAAAVLVTRSDVAADLPEHGARRLLLDDGAETPAGADERAPEDGAVPANAAYVLHTSGSTGRPKGVVVTHAAVARLFAATEPWFGFGEDDVWTLFHSYAFDFSVWELWGALLHGGRLVVVPYLTSRSPEDFLALLRRERATVLNQTPSAFRQLAAAEAAKPLVGEELALRWVIFGGEALEPATLASWLDRHGEDRPRLVNMYGITETTVHVTHRPLGRADLGARSPIGGPIPDLSLVLLDASGQLVPLGVPGEIHVGGAGLARGYLGRPDLTAERFVPDAFGGMPGGRLYRSGDLGRRLAGGDVEYLGRIDDQVKVRGFRIELGEVEAALAAHPAVREAVVVADGDRLAPRLVAYFTAGHPSPSAAELRGFVESSLPEYMVPAVYVPLERLPLTPHGKVDRRALPSASGAGLRAGGDQAAPRTLAEEALAAIWSQVLGVDAVGVHDNFFALGGDSIRSIQVLALARERGIELTLQQLFRRQTIAELAAEAGDPAGAAEEAGAAFRTEPFSLVPEMDRPRLEEGLEDAYPLAMLQAGMLFHMALRPEEPPYHNVDSWHLRARFEREAFARAVALVVARHPVMRTSFHLNAYSEPLQLVHRSAEVPLAVTDLRHLPAEGQRREIDDYIAAEKRRLFDLTRAPQLRIHVHLRDEETFQFTLTENHAIFDGWSLHATLAEVFGRYFALLRGEEPAAEPPLALTYRDFVAAERRVVESEECRSWWSRKLEDATVLELPRWPQDTGTEGGRTRRLETPVPPEVADGLRRLARGAAVPLKSVLLAAQLRTMALLSGQTDVMIGLVFNGRPEELGGEELRGLFLNTLPLRLRLDGSPWSDLVRRAFEAEREVLPYRRYPLNVLQQERGGQPLFDVIFNYVHFHVVEDLLRSGDVAVLGFKGAEGTNYLLQITFAPGRPGGEIHFLVEYDAARLPDERAAWIAGHFHRVFAAMAAAPEARSAGPELLAPEERAQLAAWTTPAEVAAGRTLHELFAAQADRDPLAVAASCEGVELAYGELDRRTNRLAHRLRRSGVGRGTLVAVSLERSLDLVVGLLAVLKAGGAYLPVDPGYPQERRRFLLGDSGAQVLLSTERLAAGLPAAGLRTLLLDDLEMPLAAESEERPEPLATLDDPAYVIYTSGSTGKPKGVLVRHGNVARLLAATEGWFGFGPADVWTLFHSFAFDFSVWELWGALAYGGRLVVVPQLTSRSPEAFLRLLREERVTVLNQTPSAFRQLAWAEDLAAGAEPDAAALALRFVIFGGEALDLASLAPWFARHGDERPRLVNMYGITETTVHVTYRPLSKADLAGSPGSRIGTAIPDLAVHVLDPWGVPAPIGVRGELFVGGAGLAAGYLGRPELTAERFLPDPFSARAGDRLYRSGDLARRLPDGDLEYLGRGDQQVKIRGFRIELGEIEAAASAHPAVRQVVVVPREDAGGERRLVAYVAADGFSFEADELRDHLRARLPEYMVPAVIVPLTSLPLTANGKVDLAALPVPAGTRPETRRTFIAPRTPLEERLAAIWSEVLRIDRVGVDDSFFDLGGNSLLVTQVFARLRDAFGVDIPMRKLFEEPTVARLAAVIQEEHAGRGVAEAPRIERRSRESRRAEQVQAKLDQLSPEEVRRLVEEKRARLQRNAE